MPVWTKRNGGAAALVIKPCLNLFMEVQVELASHNNLVYMPASDNIRKGNLYLEPLDSDHFRVIQEGAYFCFVGCYTCTTPNLNGITGATFGLMQEGSSIRKDCVVENVTGRGWGSSSCMTYLRKDTVLSVICTVNAIPDGTVVSMSDLKFQLVPMFNVDTPVKNPKDKDKEK